MIQKFNKVALVYNANKKENTDLVKQLEQFLKSKNISCWVGKTSVPDGELHTIPSDVNFATVLGGDGTLLGTSRVLAPKGIAMFGVNTGHLGFLTEGRSGDIQKLIEQVLNGQCKTEERAMLSVSLVGNKKQAPMFALNDVVINRGTNRKMIHMTLSVDDRAVADYLADWLIIATPTGSTAYALSAGGAVMDPEIKGIEIVPICAHSLKSRPHIVADTRTLTITFNRPHEGTILQLDGQETVKVNDGDKIEIKRAPYSAKLIRLLGIESDFYWRVKEKFH